MRVHAIDAAEGDSLLLENDDVFALIDGGVPGNYSRNVEPYLTATLPAGGRLEAVMVSHIDADHIAGILDLCADIERARADGEADPFVIADLWHNGFGPTLETANGALFANLQAMMSQAGRANVLSAHGSVALLGIAQGVRLLRVAAQLHIPVNAFFGESLISQESAVGRIWALGDVNFTVSGPTKANLAELQAEWVKWIEKHLDAFALDDKQAMANADKSIPNLSSIVLLGETPHGDILLTGDARGDHILQGLEQSGKLAAGQRLALKLLKVQHHASDRNAAPDFFARLPADIYLISANGKHGNPDIDTLKMIVDAAHADQRRITIVVTNEAPSLAALRLERPAGQFDYELIVRDPGRHAVRIDLETGSVQ